MHLEPGFGVQLRHGLRRSIAGAARRWLLIATLLLGILAAVGVALEAPVTSVGTVPGPVQLLMSVLVPLSGVWLAHDLTRHAERAAAPTILAAALYAAAVAVVGAVIATLAVATLSTADVSTQGFLPVALGSVGVQVTAQLVGTGLGLLQRRALVAFALTIVLPLGIWLLLGLVGPLARLQRWLTPFGASPLVLTDAPEAGHVAGWLVVTVLWGGLLNGMGLRHLRAERATGSRSVL